VSPLMFARPPKDMVRGHIHSKSACMWLVALWAAHCPAAHVAGPHHRQELAGCFGAGKAPSSVLGSQPASVA
jgi:hypothetical protein